MKKTLMTLAITSGIALFSFGCPAQNAAGGDKPASGASGSFATRADFLKFADCIKANEKSTPEIKTQMETWVNKVNTISDADWSSVASMYKGYTEGLSNMGCNK